MNTQANAMPESFDSQRIAPAVMSATRPLYWSVRRELWEYRSIYIAPVAVAAVTLFGYLIASMGYAMSLTNLNERRAALQEPSDFAAGVMMATMILITVFYCADALYGERRDRSILFWKSLPVSDLTTVLAKASIPFVVLPVLTFAITVVLQFIMLLMSSAALLASGMNVAPLWTQMSLMRMWLLLYHLLTAHTLWPAPVYCWLLLVSGWSRRATLLWAALPVVAIAAVEKVVFQTSRFAALVGARFIGATPTIASTAPGMFPTDPMTHITPGTFFSTPGLWIGLVIAAGFLAAAVRTRRYQGPI